MILKKINLTRLILGVIISIMVCFGSWAQETIELRGATITTLSEPRGQAGLRFIELVEAKSKGRIKGTWYHSGQLGAESEIQEQLLENTIQFASYSAAVAGQLNPKVTTMYCPYLIKSWEVFKDKWIGSKGAQLILDSLQGNGLQGLGWVPYGFNALDYRGEPILKLEDIPGRRIRSAEIYSIRETILALGADAPTTPWSDVYQAVQMNLVDGFTAPPSTIAPSSLYEVVDKMTLSNHLFGSHILWIRQDVLDNLPEDLRNIVLESAEEACAWEQAQMLDFEKQSIKDLVENKGMTAYELEEEEMERWIEATNKVWSIHEEKINEKSGDGREFLIEVFASMGRDYEKEVLGQ